MIADFGRQSAYLIDDARPGPRKANVGRDDAQIGHEVQEPLFDVKRRIGHGGRLEPVAQRLVVEVDADARPIKAAPAPPIGRLAIPIVDQLPLVHAFSVASPLVQVKRAAAPLHDGLTQPYLAVDAGRH